MHKLKIEVTKFALVGAINFVITFLIFYGMLEEMKVNYLISLVAAWSVGVTFTYTLNYVWVFKPEERLRFKMRFLKYLIANLVSFGINVILLVVLVEAVGMDAFYSQALLIPIVVIFNFLSTKYWSLHSKKVGLSQLTCRRTATAVQEKNG